MSRFARHVDANQTAIVEALRKVGAVVVHLHTVGGGVPDLLVGWRGSWLLAEVKDGSKPPSRRALNPAQLAWHSAAQAAGLPVLVVTSPAHAVETLHAL